MKSILIYLSRTGFTKKYVDSISRRNPEIEVVPYKKAKWSKLKNYDCIFYGAPLTGNKIRGLNKLLKHYDKIENKNIFVFTTGIEPITNEKRENVISMNGLSFYHIRLYLLPGGLDFHKLPKLEQKIMLKALESEATKYNASLDMIKDRFKDPIDQTDMDYLYKMLDVYHRLKLKEGIDNDKKIK